MLSKLYISILTLFLSIIFFINTTVALFGNSYYALFNLKNINHKFHATKYIFKHIILESGVILKNDHKKSLKPVISALSNKYGISENAIICIIDNGRVYNITEEGYMGLTNLNKAQLDFYNIKDPFDPEENLKAGISEINLVYHNNLTKSLYYDSTTIKQYIDKITKCLIIQ